MQYADGQVVEIDDKVDLGGHMTGVVVAIPGEKVFSERYPAQDWGYMNEGMLVESKEAGLIQYTEQDHQRIELLSRG